MVKKLFETAFDCNDCNSDYPLCNRTAWINHRKWSAIRNQRNLWVCTMACDDAVCRIYAVYRNDWNALAFVPASMLGISGVGYDLM